MRERLEKLVSLLSDSDFHQWLKNWKPIHLCWLYRKMGWKIPRYLIGSDPANVLQTHFIKGADDSSDPDTCTWGSEDDSDLEHEKEDPFMLRIQIANTGGKDSGVSAWSLWYSTTAQDGGTNQVTTSSNVVRIVNDSPNQIADQTLTDAGVMTATGTRLDGYYTDASDATISVKVPDAQYFEHQFCIQFQSDASAEQDYYFYIREAGAAINGYNNVPVITAKAGEVIVTPSALSISATLNAPTIIVDASYITTALALTAAYPAPSVVCDVTISPSALTLTAAYPAPSIVCDVTVSPSALALTAAYPAPSIVCDVTVSPSALALTAAYPAPSIICDVTVSPSALTMTAVVIDPSILIPEPPTGGEPTALMKPTRGLQLNKIHPLACGLVGCWLMNENSGKIACDISGNHYTGALSAGASFVPAKFGSGVDVDGDNKQIAVSSGLIITNPFTANIWHKCDDYTVLGSDPRHFFGFYKITSPWNGWAFAQSYSGGYRLQYWSGAKGSWQNLTTSTPTGGKYHLFTTTCFGTTTKFYIDGVYAGSVTSNEPNSYADTKFIGQRIDGSLGCTGIIDHVMVWNRALSASEIESLYREPFQMFEREVSQALISYVPSSIVTPTALALSAAVNAPTAISDVTVSPSVLALTAAYPAPSVVCDVTVSPSSLSLMAAINSPTIIGDVTVSPSSLALTSAVVDPVVDISGNATVYPSAQAISAAIQDPAVLIDAMIQPTAIGLSAALNSPNVVPNTIVTPTAISLLSSQQVISIVINTAHTASALNMAGTVNAPSLDISVDILPSALALTGQVIAPSFAIGSVFAPSALDLQTTINDPSVIISGAGAMPWLAFFVIRQCMR